MTLFAPFPDDRFAVIYADPPWRFPGGKGSRDQRRGKSAVDHYPVVSFSDLACLPVADISASDAVLCCWLVQSELPDCIAVCEAWGFRWSTVGWVWHKQRQHLGHYTHPAVELCAIFSRGKPSRVARGSFSERQFISTPYTAHSVKPDAVRQSIQRLWPTAARIELFARTAHRGWAAWGDEINVEQSSLPAEQGTLL